MIDKPFDVVAGLFFGLLERVGTERLGSAEAAA